MKTARVRSIWGAYGEGMPAAHTAYGEGMPAAHTVYGEGMPAAHTQLSSRHHSRDITLLCQAVSGRLLQFELVDH